MEDDLASLRADNNDLRGKYLGLQAILASMLTDYLQHLTEDGRAKFLDTAINTVALSKLTDFNPDEEATIRGRAEQVVMALATARIVDV